MDWRGLESENELSNEIKCVKNGEVWSNRSLHTNEHEIIV